MLKIAYIDDENDLFDDYKDSFEQHGIELLFVDWGFNMQEILEWVAENQVECMLVDYQLKKKYTFLGTELVPFLNRELPDFPCIMLTSHAEEAIEQNLVMQSLFIERENLDNHSSDDFLEVVSEVNQAVQVFRNRMNKRKEEFTALKLKRDKGTITAQEEENFVSLYKILRAYGEVDMLAADVLKSDAVKTMEDILKNLRKLTSNKE